MQPRLSKLATSLGSVLLVLGAFHRYIRLNLDHPESGTVLTDLSSAQATAEQPNGSRSLPSLSPRLPALEFPLELLSTGDAKLNWTRLEAEERRLLKSSSIFSVAGLQCPLMWSKGLQLPARQRVVAFAYDKLSGSTFLRAHMLAAAVSTFKGWQGVVVVTPKMAHQLSTALPAFNSGQLRPEICILVKHAMPMWRWCAQHAAKLIFFDLLDNTLAFKEYWYGGPLRGTDVLLAPTEALANATRYGNPVNESGRLAGIPRAFAWYHQHSNPGFTSDIRRMASPHLCRVALYLSSLHHSMDAKMAINFKYKVCAAQHVWAFAILQTYGGKNGIRDYPCPRRSREMAVACRQLDAESAARAESARAVDTEHKRSGCFAGQDGFHNATHMSLIDAILILPEYESLLARGRPSTRFLHWASHGVPVIFWEYQAYIEIATAGGYRLPSGALPMVRFNAFRLHLTLNELNSSSSRLYLRQRGFELAAKFSVRGVAAHLIDFYAQYELGLVERSALES